MKIRNDIPSCKSCVYRNLIFGDLNDIEYKLVNENRQEIFFKRGEIIKKEGDPIDSFLYLRKGLVKLFKTDHNHKDHILTVNHPGDFVSLLSLFSTKEYKYSIAALEDTLVCLVDIEILKYLVGSNGKFSLQVMNKMCQISDAIIQSRFEQSQKQVKGRVAHLLLSFADQVYHKNEFVLHLTRREIGELISITTENTIRTLSEFRKEGIIDVDGKKVLILDKDRLISINKGS